MDPIVKPTPTPKKGGRLRRFVATIGFTVALGLVPLAGQAVTPQASPVLAPASAYAGDCTLGVLCGSVKNDSRSKTSIKVYNSWSGGTEYVPSGDAATVKPGKFGPWKDDDGFCIPLGHKGYVLIYAKKTAQSLTVKIGDAAPRCFKISDPWNAYVNVTGKASWYAKMLKVPAKYVKAVASAKAKLAKAEKALKAAKASAKKAKTSAAKKAAKKKVDAAELTRNMARNLVAYEQLTFSRVKALRKIQADSEAKLRDCSAIRARKGSGAKCVE